MEVEPSQSGQTLRCGCGREVEVPSMLELRKLSLASVEASVQPPQQWGIRHRLVSIGSLILVGALVWLGVLGLLWPQKPQVPETITWQTPPPPGSKEPLRKTTEQLTLLESYAAWESLPRELEVLSDAPMTRYKKELATAKNWLLVGSVIAILGLACIVSAWLVPAQGAGRRAPTPRVKASRRQ